MEEQKFENIEDLLRFVLDECGDMKYSYSTTSRGFTKPYCVGLTIKLNPDLQRICYADMLLRQHFDVYIDTLEINSASMNVFNIGNANSLHIDIEGEFIQRMNKLRVLELKTTTQETISDLPDTVEELTLNRQTVINLLDNDNGNTLDDKILEIGGQHFKYKGYFNGLYFFKSTKTFL